MNAITTLDDLYLQYRKTKNAESKQQIMFNIIEIKQFYNYINYKYPLYTDVKYFIRFYFASKEFKDYGYDTINNDKILNCIKMLDEEKQLSILLYLKRTLQQLFMDTGWVDKQINRIQAIIYKKKHNIFLWLLYYSTSSFAKTITTIILLYLIACLVLIPVDNPIYPIFRIEYGDYSSNFILNHFVNFISFLFGLDTDFKIVCISWYGIIIQSISKFFFFILIANFLYLKAQKYLFIK